MSSQQGTQTATPREMIPFHRKRIIEAEAAVLANPDEENLANLRSVLDESRKFREALREARWIYSKTKEVPNPCSDITRN